LTLRWYIVHAYSNYEYKVKSSLEERVTLMGLEHKFGEILIDMGVTTQEQVEHALQEQKESEW